MISKQAEKFRVLGVESRIRIIELLKQRGPLCVNELSEVLGISPSAVSQHLKVLKYAGLVRNERRGYWIHYEVDPVALEQCNELLSEVCMCKCNNTGQFSEVEVDKTQNDLALLRKFERELEQELREVRARIKGAEQDG
jgi:DNA-binding transcriptional ArsR family regulator